LSNFETKRTRRRNESKVLAHDTYRT